MLKQRVLDEDTLRLKKPVQDLIEIEWASNGRGEGHTTNAKKEYVRMCICVYICVSVCVCKI